MIGRVLDWLATPTEVSRLTLTCFLVCAAGAIANLFWQAS